MKLVLTPLRQKALALLLALGTAGAAAVLAVQPLWQSASLQAERVGMLRAQAGRLEALAAAAPKFDDLARQIAMNPDVAGLTIASVEPGVGVAELQTGLNDIFGAAGATVMSGEALNRAGNTVAVETTVETDIATLVRALHGVASARPLMRIEQLSIREPDGEWTAPSGTASAPNKLIAVIVVSAWTRAP